MKAYLYQDYAMQELFDGSELEFKWRFTEYKRAFHFFDVNHDGKITIDEMEAAMNKCGQYPSKLELRLLMLQADIDREHLLMLHTMNPVDALWGYFTRILCVIEGIVECVEKNPLSDTESNRRTIILVVLCC